MNFNPLHKWDVSTAEARNLQLELAGRLLLKNSLPPNAIRQIAAADISFNRRGKFLFAGVVLVGFPGLEIQEIFLKKVEARFPYVPGFLSFREAPAVLEIFREIPGKPDLLLCDGQGIAHPRGIGLASHLGLFLDMPAIGCAKSVLVGEYKMPGDKKGKHTPLVYRGKTVGAVLRTRRGVKPVFVSPGHKIALESSVELVLACTPRYRLPEPLRIAHQQVNLFRRSANNSGKTQSQ